MNVLDAALQAMREGRPAALVTVIHAEGSAPRHAGSRMLVRADGSTVGTIGGGAIEKRATDEARGAISTGRPRRHAFNLGPELGMICGGSMEIFIEPLAVPPRLFLFGAGHVSHSTAPLVRSLGFQVTVVDARSELATAARFPDCEIRCEDPISFAAGLQTDERTWILILSHSHAVDEQVLQHLAPRPWAWLGCIGSRTKAVRFLHHLQETGLDEATLARISTPVGLDLGAETPEEIAVSIAAEVVCRLRGHTGAAAPMRDRPAQAPARTCAGGT